MASISVSIPSTASASIGTGTTATTTPTVNGIGASTVAAAIQDATVRFLRETYLPKIVELAHERKGELTVDELAKILGETHISPVRAASHPVSTVTAPAASAASSAGSAHITPSLVTAASTAGTASGSACMHIGTRGNVKGMQCSRPRVPGTMFCSSHKNSVMARNLGGTGSAPAAAPAASTAAPASTASMQDEAHRMLQQLLGTSAVSS
jgi:hypothetical protein